MAFLLPRTAEYRKALLAVMLVGSVFLLAGGRVKAQQSASVSISVKEHRFQPGQISAPANRPLIGHSPTRSER